MSEPGEDTGDPESRTTDESGFELDLDPIQKPLRRLKRKDPVTFRQLKKKLEEIRKRPEIGDPKSYYIKGCRSVHIGPYVLLYILEGRRVTALSFRHHDKTYRGGGA